MNKKKERKRKVASNHSAVECNRVQCSECRSKLATTTTATTTTERISPVRATNERTNDRCVNTIVRRGKRPARSTTVSDPRNPQPNHAGMNQKPLEQDGTTGTTRSFFFRGTGTMDDDSRAPEAESHLPFGHPPSLGFPPCRVS